MIGTLQDRKLKSGDMVNAHIGSGVYTAKIVDAGDPSKIKIKLTSGLELWIGRRAVVDLVNED